MRGHNNPFRSVETGASVRFFKFNSHVLCVPRRFDWYTSFEPSAERDGYTSADGSLVSFFHWPASFPSLAKIGMLQISTFSDCFENTTLPSSVAQGWAWMPSPDVISMGLAVMSRVGRISACHTFEPAPSGSEKYRRLLFQSPGATHTSERTTACCRKARHPFVFCGGLPSTGAIHQSAPVAPSVVPLRPGNSRLPPSRDHTG